MIKSPFQTDDQKMFMEIEDVLHKYGFQHVTLIYTEAVNDHYSNYRCSSSQVSEGLVEYLNLLAEQMQEFNNEETD